jgi:hypothetical protein
MRSRLALTLIGALALATTAAAPVAAAANTSKTPPPDYGSTVACKYHTNEDTNWSFKAKFRRIVVTPPQMFATSGRQTVGWRFVVERGISLYYGDEPTTWTVTYTSPTEKRVATTTRAAAFDSMRVGVTVPKGDWDASDVEYQVKLQMFRYGANGSVHSKTSYLMPTYELYVNGEDWDQESLCLGLAEQWFDGPF